MTKLPWIKFWYRDWLADKDIRRTKDYARAYWIDTLCYFWEAGVYQMKLLVSDWAGMWGCTGAKAIRVIRELERTSVASVTCHGASVTVAAYVTLMSRRLKREAGGRTQAAERKRRERSRGSHADVTPMSQSHTDTETEAETEAGGYDPPQSWKSFLVKYPDATWGNKNTRCVTADGSMTAIGERIVEAFKRMGVPVDRAVNDFKSRRFAATQRGDPKFPSDLLVSYADEVAMKATAYERDCRRAKARAAESARRGDGQDARAQG